MREWGWMQPVVVGEDGTTIADYGRVLAGLRLGLGEAPGSRRTRERLADSPQPGTHTRRAQAWPSVPRAHQATVHGPHGDDDRASARVISTRVS
jgi:hypothetical protein